MSEVFFFFIIIILAVGGRKGGHICWRCCGSALIGVQGLCVGRRSVASRRETVHCDKGLFSSLRGAVTP